MSIWTVEYLKGALVDLKKLDHSQQLQILLATNQSSLIGLGSINISVLLDLPPKEKEESR